MKGQALVETAIIAPFLIFIMVGVFEVGWALRGYYILASSNREAARYAARPHYINDPKMVYKHFLDSVDGTIPFEKNNGRILVTELAVENQCSSVFTDTILISWSYPISMTTHLNITDTFKEMEALQYRVACLNKPYPTIRDARVYVELWYDQPQLFGFPLVSNPFTDPVQMYDRVSFRVLEYARQ